MVLESRCGIIFTYTNVFSLEILAILFIAVTIPSQSTCYRYKEDHKDYYFQGTYFFKS